MTQADAPSRAVLIAALVIAVGAVGAVLAVAVSRRPPQQPVAIAAVPAPRATDPACRALLDKLPQRVGDYRRAPVAPPAPEGAAAWRAVDGGTVVLRCGLDRPDDFVVGSPIQVVDSVQWFQAGTGDRPSWYAVDRPVYVVLTLPPGSGPEPIQQVSEVIGDTIAAVPISPGPVR